jgi:D-3-phosphoglycerate dehydrogenase
MILLTHARAEREIYYGTEALAALRAIAPVRINETDVPLAGQTLIAAADGCSIVIGDSKVDADASFFSAAPELIAYVHNHVDLRRVDVAAASANGILVTRTSAGFAAAVSELVIGFMVDLARGITAASSLWRSGGSPRTALTRQLSGSTIGIIGYGAIGRHLSRVVRAVGMRVLVNDPYVDLSNEPAIIPVTLDELLAGADFVVPLAVATPETENLIDARALSLMKPGAYLVNVSRGELVDEAALEETLERKAIAGAALDVGRAPFQMPSPRLAVRPDVIATPHIGGSTPEATRHQAMETVQQVVAILTGAVPPGAANPGRASRLRTPGKPGT